MAPSIITQCWTDFRYVYFIYVCVFNRCHWHLLLHLLLLRVVWSFYSCIRFFDFLLILLCYLLQFQCVFNICVCVYVFLSFVYVCVFIFVTILCVNAFHGAFYPHLCDIFPKLYILPWEYVYFSFEQFYIFSCLWERSTIPFNIYVSFVWSVFDPYLFVYLCIYTLWMLPQSVWLCLLKLPLLDSIDHQKVVNSKHFPFFLSLLSILFLCRCPVGGYESFVHFINHSRSYQTNILTQQHPT